MQNPVRSFAATIMALGAFVSTAYADATVNFKTAGTVNPVLYSLDGQNITGAVPASTGQIPGFGTVSYEIYTAAVGTVLTLGANGLPNLTGWTGTAVGPVSYVSDGVILSDILTLPTAPAQDVEMEIIAYTGTLANPTFYAFSGEEFDGNNTVTGPNDTVSTGALGWQNHTGDPGNALSTPGTIVTKSAGFGALVLQEVPDVTETLPLLGAAFAGLAFVRRKIFQS